MNINLYSCVEMEREASDVAFYGVLFPLSKELLLAPLSVLVSSRRKAHNKCKTFLIHFYASDSIRCLPFVPVNDWLQWRLGSAWGNNEVLKKKTEPNGIGTKSLPHRPLSLDNEAPCIPHAHAGIRATIKDTVRHSSLRAWNVTISYVWWAMSANSPSYLHRHC